MSRACDVLTRLLKLRINLGSGSALAATGAFWDWQSADTVAVELTLSKAFERARLSCRWLHTRSPFIDQQHLGAECSCKPNVWAVTVRLDAQGRTADSPQVCRVIPSARQAP
jgi:hypothetical protein